MGERDGIRDKTRRSSPNETLKGHTHPRKGGHWGGGFKTHEKYVEIPAHKRVPCGAHISTRREPN